MNGEKSLKITCRQCQTRLDMSDLEPFTVVECPVCGTRLRVPKFFDRYLLEKVCGSGSSTTVYRALDPRLSRRVAVKVLNTSVDDADELGRRFLAEAKLVASLNHIGILPVYNCGVCDGQPYLVMRYMERGNDIVRVAAAAAPLLGLLGTVTGMVATFDVITLYGNQNPVLMADGISEALISTQSGLLIAFPLTLLRQRLEERIEDLGQQIALGATVIENLAGRG